MESSLQSQERNTRIIFMSLHEGERLKKKTQLHILFVKAVSKAI